MRPFLIEFARRLKGDMPTSSTSVVKVNEFIVTGSLTNED